MAFQSFYIHIFRLTNEKKKIICYSIEKYRLGLKQKREHLSLAIYN